MFTGGFTRNAANRPGQTRTFIAAIIFGNKKSGPLSMPALRRFPFGSKPFYTKIRYRAAPLVGKMSLRFSRWHAAQ
jgi:hypothetical protein